MKIENHLNVIRLAGQGDAVAMAYLFGQLGYPASPVEVAERWLQPAPDREVLLGRGSGSAGVASPAALACCTRLGPDLGAGRR